MLTKNSYWPMFPIRQLSCLGRYRNPAIEYVAPMSIWISWGGGVVPVEYAVCQKEAGEPSKAHVAGLPLVSWLSTSCNDHPVWGISAFTAVETSGTL